MYENGVLGWVYSILNKCILYMSIFKLVLLLLLLLLLLCLVCMLAATSCKRHYLIHAERHLSRIFFILLFFLVLEAVRWVMCKKRCKINIKKCYIYYLIELNKKRKKRKTSCQWNWNFLVSYFILTQWK